MNNWKPADTTNIMQQFQDFDNEGFDVSKILFDIVQNLKLRFSQCREVFVFGLQFTESSTASNCTARTVENYATVRLPETLPENSSKQKL